MKTSKTPQAKRKKKCKVCHQQFIPRSSTQVACSLPCALGVALAKTEKRERKRLRDDRERIKPRGKLMAEAQTAFNAFIRLRDEGLSCVSCDVLNPPERPGGAWDCGHYLTRGAHPELRFNEDNAWRQCKSCNGGAGNWSGKSRTVQQEYREQLVRRIGIERVAALEGPHNAEHWSADDLRAIKLKYREMSRELKKSRQ